MALTAGRARMWRKRIESGAEPNTNAPRKKIESTGPTIGRPSAVAVASESRTMPWQPLGDLLGGEALVGRVDAQQVLAGGGVARVEERLEALEILRGLVHQAAFGRASARGSTARIAARRVFALGSITGVSPNLIASAWRRSGCATDRSSPLRPSSPKQAIGPLAVAGHDAALGARHRERDREVGARLVDPHAAGDVDEHVGAPGPDARVAAEHGEHEREPVAVDPVGDPARRHELGRRHERLHLDEQRPRALHGGEHDAAGRARGLADEARRRVGDLDQPAAGHLEHAGLVGRAEAVLERAQRAVRALALALELQHAVDEVLEHARAGQRALLGDVADEQHGDVARLGEPRDAVGDLAHLADRAGRAGQLGRVQRLHRVDHADLRPLGVERRQHRLQVGLGHHRHLQRGAGEPLGAQLDLRRRLLAGDVERAPAGAGEVAERHRGQRRLADAGRAAEQHERAGHEPAAEHAVELADPGLQPRDLRRLDLGEGDGLDRPAGRGRGPATTGARGRRRAGLPR